MLPLIINQFRGVQQSKKKTGNNQFNSIQSTRMPYLCRIPISRSNCSAFSVPSIACRSLLNTLYALISFSSLGSVLVFKYIPIRADNIRQTMPNFNWIAMAYSVAQKRKYIKQVKYVKTLESVLLLLVLSVSSDDRIPKVFSLSERVVEEVRDSVSSLSELLSLLAFRLLLCVLDFVLAPVLSLSFCN